MILVFGIWAFARALFVNSGAVSLENVALRHQLAVLQRSVNRPRFRRCDRIFWLWLARLWRRECLDHVIVINARRLRRLLRSYLAYYNATRPHQALDNESPHPREAQTPAGGRIVAIPQVGGLHHRYQRAA